MLKIALFLAAAIIFWRLAFGSWPWAMAATKSGSRLSDVRSTAEARKILGVGKDASHEDIVRAHRLLVGETHPDKGGDGLATARANAARDLLIGRPLRDRDSAED